MTIKILSGTYSSGYTLSSAFSGVSVTGTGDVLGPAGSNGAYNAGAGGAALTLPKLAAATNDGFISGGAGGLGGTTDFNGGAGGAGGAGISLAAGGSVTNVNAIYGGAGGGGGDGGHDGGAGGAGGAGVYFAAAGTVTNSGVIAGGHGGSGGAGDYAGIRGIGGTGVDLAAGGALFNTGQITAGADGAGAGNAYTIGVLLATGGTIVNGSKTDSSARIAGDFGIVAFAGGTVIKNYGRIDAYTNFAVQLGLTTDRLIAESGCAFLGPSYGGGGILELAGGAGTIASLGSIVSVSGSITGDFYRFGAYVLDAGGAWTLSGPNDLAGGKSLTSEAALTIAAGASLTVENGATFSAQGAISNNGVVSLAGAASLTDLRVLGGGATLSGGGTIVLGGPKNRIYGASASTILTNDNAVVGSGFIGLSRLTLVNQAGGVIDASTGTIVLNTSGKSVTNRGLMEASGGGHLNIQNTTVDDSGAGILGVTAGSTIGLLGARLIGGGLFSSGNGRIVTFNGANLIDGTTSPVTDGATVSITDNTSLTMQGQVANSGSIVVNATSHTTHLTVGSAGLTLTGAGTVTLSNNALNRVSGVTAAATFTNVNNKISGAGQLGVGSMILVNQAKGVIDANGSVALFINTGTNTITNAGTIEAVGSGGATITSAVNNTGVLEAAGGVLTVNGAVSGAGKGVIASGTLDFASTFTEGVAFTGTTGVLELAHSQTYSGSISGFSKTGGTSLDLRDIAFGGSTKASFSGTTTSGTLTVTDGTHTAKIKLTGNYTASTFVVSTDGHGGTKVVDPTRPATALAFLGAMSAFGAAAGGVVAPAQMRRLDHPMLAAGGHAAVA
jgi:hypothetical protein